MDADEPRARERLDEERRTSQTGSSRRELLERLGHRLRRGEAIDRQLLDGAHHDALERRRNVGSTAVQRDRGVPPDAERRGPLVPIVSPLEGTRPAEQLVEDDAEREKIAARVDAFAQDLFGRHVRGRSERGDVLEPQGRERDLVGAGRALRDPEVEDLDVTVPAHEDVRRLDVAVDDAALVRVGQPSRDGRADDGDRVRRERGLLLGDGGEAEAVDELEREMHARVALREGVEHADVRVREGREDARLALELRRRTASPARSCS